MTPKQKFQTIIRKDDFKEAVKKSGKLGNKTTASIYVLLMSGQIKDKDLVILEPMIDEWIRIENEKIREIKVEFEEVVFEKEKAIACECNNTERVEVGSGSWNIHCKDCGKNW